jgi:hypothetical protein
VGAEPPFAATPAWFGSIASTTAIAIGDLDTDGTLDLVRGNQGGFSAVHLNTGRRFSTTSSWAGPEEGTQDIALGDVDGDGDLDLVRQNYDRGVTLYLNAAGTFAADTAWMGPPADAIALADVDGDGRLDLVCTSAFRPTAIHLNVGGTFSRTPLLSGSGENTRCLALGDINGDGRLDVVRGNAFAGSSLHLNLGGTFDAARAWTGRVATTTGLALGDIDGDGRLDLVCGDAEGAALYLNTGTTFAPTPVWVGPAAGRLALGDVDGDGDLDLVIGGIATTVHLNSGGTFETAPAWTGPDENTTCVTLGDVDGDGDLDLVRGNYGQAATLYLNRTPDLGAQPAWEGGSAHTHAVALADVDGDGRLDLVRGNAGQPPTLDFNRDGVLLPAPWSPPGQNTYGIALGDLDRDGRPDLVCANQNDGVTLFRNTGAGLAATPSRIGSAQRTWSVALGDLDGDGAPDLVRGNQDQTSTVYRNTGSGFDSVAALTRSDTRAVALGDVDGDGRVDVVRGNYGQPATVHLNAGGVPGDAAPWSNPAETTTGIALGDVDGDGHVDLVRGNDAPLQTTLYSGSGAAFESTPAWSGLAEQTAAVALGDIDGDGWLDLARGNLARPSTLYLNDGGRFGLAPVWASPTADTTRSVALGDIDGDGRLDLVCGNDGTGPGGTPTRIYAHRRPWIVDVTGGAPRNHLPNGPAWLRWVRGTAAGANHYRLEFQAFDVESDPLWLIGEYQFEGSGTWQPMRINGAELRAGRLATSGAGTAHTLDWDVTSIPFDRRPVTVRLRTVSLPGRTGATQFVPSYLANVGRVLPARPELQASPAALEFPTMTVGDSVNAPVVIANPGNQDLVIDAVDLPDTSITFGATLPLVVPPGATIQVGVGLAPRRALAPLGPIRLHGNDPLRPAADLPLITDIRALAIETRLLVEGSELPLGEAATIVVTPAPQVHFDAGELWFRPRLANAGFESRPLVAQGANYVVLVPGDRITEAGLDYYVRVTNRAAVTFDPATAPDSTFSQGVTPPAGITSFARVDSAGGNPVGQPMSIITTLPRGTGFGDATLFFRAGGAAEWDSTSFDAAELTPGSGSHTATIPAVATGPRGIEYWVRVRTLTRTLTDPAPDPALHPHGVRTTISNLAEDATHAAERYRMLSIPMELGPPPAASLEAVLFDDLGALIPSQWRAFRYAGGRYLEVNSTPSGELSPVPGRAFWVVGRDAHRVDTAPITGRSTSTAAPYRIPLEPGWNQIGNPFAFPVAWENVRAEGPAGEICVEPPVRWNETAASYDTADVEWLAPFAGYWVKNPLQEPAALLVPPVTAAPLASTSCYSAATLPVNDSGAWRIQIVTAVEGSSAARHFAGVARSASDGTDRFDRSPPPLAPESSVGLAFLPPEGGERRAVDIRAAIPPGGDPGALGWRWPFSFSGSVPASVARPMQLEFRGVDRVPDGLEVRLIDRVLERSIDLRAQTGYTCVFDGSSDADQAATCRFELQVGTPDYLETLRHPRTALTTRLLPIYPNPVVSSATLRFATSRPGRATLALHDILGRRVCILVDGPHDAGIHEVAWTGDDDSGRRLEPGVYWLRLTGPDRAETRKLIKMR